jgi:L-phenylalanine/L-methionine N-acetyltransferase
MTDFRIRRQEPEDAVALHEIYSQPKVIFGTTMLPHPSLHVWKKAADEPRGMTRLVACVDDQVVGNIALSTTAASPRRRHVGEIAMAVHDSWQGKGCGYALLSAALDLADNWMDLRRIELQVYTDNERGVRLYERCGFEIEGTLKQFAFRDGKYVDVYAMARLRGL